MIKKTHSVKSLSSTSDSKRRVEAAGRSEQSGWEKDAAGVDVYTAFPLLRTYRQVPLSDHYSDLLDLSTVA